MSYQESSATALDYARNEEMLRTLAKIEAFNRDPRIFKDRDKEELIALASQLGLSVERAKKKDKATLLEQAGAGAGGFVDAMAFGLIPDSWYSSYRTNVGKNIGKAGGTIASFVIPGIGAAKGFGALGKIGRNAFRASKNAYGVMGGVKSAKSAKDAVALAKLIFSEGGRSAISTAKAARKLVGSKAILMAAARALQASNTIPGAFTSTGEMSPYDLAALSEMSTGY